MSDFKENWSYKMYSLYLQYLNTARCVSSNKLLNIQA